MNSYDYQTILNLLQQKDPKGLEVLYTRYGKPFYAYAVGKWGLSADEAWETVYKTLETLVQKLPGYEFRSQTAFDSFLFKVFINFLRQQYRSDRARQLPALVFVDLEKEFELAPYIREALTGKAFTDFYQSDSLESPEMQTLKNALDQMELGEKDILLLRAQNYSYDEIAQFLGIENNQLKVKHHRAKQKLIGIINNKIK